MKRAVKWTLTASTSIDRRPVRKRQDGCRRPRKEQCGRLGPSTVDGLWSTYINIDRRRRPHCSFLGQRRPVEKVSGRRWPVEKVSGWRLPVEKVSMVDSRRWPLPFSRSMAGSPFHHALEKVVCDQFTKFLEKITSYLKTSTVSEQKGQQSCRRTR